MFSPRGARAGHAGVESMQSAQDKIQCRPGRTRGPAPSCGNPRGLTPCPPRAPGPISVIQAPWRRSIRRQTWKHGGYRSGHPGNRAVREDRRPAEELTAARTAAPDGRHNAAAQRRRAGDPGDDADDPRIHVRGAVAPPRPCASAALVPSSPVTTSDCARPPNSSVRSHANWPRTQHCGPTMYGQWTPHRSNAAVPGSARKADTGRTRP
jgi:hypothetical protein